jgi:hypothetical protein
MHLSSPATALTISLLFACAYCTAQDRRSSSSQRYRIHVPKEVKFGQVEAAPANEPPAPLADADAESLLFMAETTSGLTIQFDMESAVPQPLKLTVGGSQTENWWANEANTESGSKGELVVEAYSVQASTFKPGWSTLQLDVPEPPAVSDAEITTIVVTIVAH